MNYREIFKQAGQGKIAPVYVLYGAETFMIEEFIQFMKQQVLDEAAIDFNFSLYDLEETPIQEAVLDAETMPFMDERRIVIVKNAFFLTGGKSNSAVEHDLDSIQKYVDQPMETTVLILIAETEKLDGRKKIVKQLQKDNTVVSFPPMHGQELWAWMVRQANKQHAQLEQGAATALERIVGQDLRRLTQEIEKIASFVGQGGVITEEVVDQLVSRTLEENIFGLIDKVSALELEQAMRIFYDLLKNNEEPLTVLHLLARQFRMILQVKVLTQKGYTQRQMASQLGVHPYPIKLAADKSARFSEAALRSILIYLAEEDFRIKSGQIDKVLSMELFMMKIKDLLQVRA
ncbi:DNA polymerase III subunit delta [Ammoniphilus oxalaticus]|uniref:DNA polymerase III subunit delta n=1 Tax=Ammoniphilus oxalaticus TaxID=66863 RepID=A0A419SJ64_9BACL|nr:DNA polymerase III subunit delta [Ammoniphilus oxalaticus]RKD23979.1 DNA polymerase III subunit delta [Ammoniphilus oxalaticus]